METGASQAFDVAAAGTDHFLGQFVEDVDVVREAGGILGGIEHDASGEAALLAPVAGKDR